MAHSNYGSIEELYNIVEDYMDDIKFLYEKIDYIIPIRLEKIKVDRVINGS